MKYNLNSLRQICFAAMFAFPIFPFKITNFFFIIFSLTVCIIFIKQRKHFNVKEWFPYLMLSLVFVPYLIEFLFYPGNSSMQFELEKKLLFFFAPTILYLNNKLGSTQVKNALICFVSSISLLAIGSFIYLTLQGEFFSRLNYENGAYGLRSAFEDFSRLHPTYFGLFATTASLWILYYQDSFKGISKIFLFIFLFFLILLNLLVASKMPLFIFFVGILALVYIKIKNTIKRTVIYVSFFTGLILMIILIPSLRSRTMEIQEYFVSQKFGNTLTERTIIFNCGKSVFFSDILTGIGARNVQGVLDYCYVWFGFHQGALIHLNPHNQYLSFGIAYGLGFLLLFVYTLFVVFRKVKSSTLALFFLLALLLIMFTESILERQMGVYYYLFFSGLFLGVANKRAQLKDVI